MADGGYRRPDLWLSDGWAVRAGQRAGSAAVLGTRRRRAGSLYTLYGPATRWIRPCRWCMSATTRPTPTPTGEVPDCPPKPSGSRPRPPNPDRPLRPWSSTPRRPGRTGPASASSTASAWQWTSSGYLPYPGFQPAPGAVGEYNGKFMVNQQVLRGSAAITPPGHARPTYRNFFPAGSPSGP